MHLRHHSSPGSRQQANTGLVTFQEGEEELRPLLVFNVYKILQPTLVLLYFSPLFIFFFSSMSKRPDSAPKPAAKKRAGPRSTAEAEEEEYQKNLLALGHLRVPDDDGAPKKISVATPPGPATSNATTSTSSISSSEFATITTKDLRCDICAANDPGTRTRNAIYNSRPVCDLCWDKIWYSHENADIVVQRLRTLYRSELPPLATTSASSSIGDSAPKPAASDVPVQPRRNNREYVLSAKSREVVQKLNSRIAEIASSGIAEKDSTWHTVMTALRKAREVVIRTDCPAAASSSSKPMPPSTSNDDAAGASLLASFLSEDDVPVCPSSAPARPHDTYYYWIEDRASYTKAQIMAHIDTWPFTVERTDDGPEMYYLNGFHRKRIMHVLGSDSSETIFANLVHCKSLVVDVSRTAGHTKCPITLEKYDCAHILNLTWRSYSVAALREAIDKSLKVGKPLRLEDCIIEPEQLSKIRLYPNFGLGEWRPFVYTDADVPPRPPFDGTTARRENIPMFSVWLDSMRAAQGWDTSIRDIYTNRYHPLRPDSALDCGCDGPAIFKDLVIQCIVFPRVAPNLQTWFINVMFSNCVILFEDLRALHFSSCAFWNCIFCIQPEGFCPKCSRCEFKDCSFYWCAEFKAGANAVPPGLLYNDSVVNGTRSFYVAKKTIGNYAAEENETVASLIARLEAAPVLNPKNELMAPLPMRLAAAPAGV